jgi:hypothetical protein
MSAVVISFYTGQPVGPATLEAMRFRSAKRAREADEELVRQIDELVEAYRFAWDVNVGSPHNKW